MKANNFFRKNIILGLGVLLLGSLGLYFGYRFLRHPQPTVGVTVFVHGTVGLTFNVLNPFHCISDTADENAWSVQAMKKYRNHPAMRYDQLLGDEGLVEFDSAQARSSEVASHLITAYDEVARLVSFGEHKKYYALFGWSGRLSQQARKIDGFALYDQLCAYRDQLRSQHGVEPVIRIVAHSHGGNVALWLAQAEQEKKRSLGVDTLFMFGTPMQRETAPHIQSMVFKKIILGYSDGDSVQGNDYFSTAERKSYMRMADVADLTKFVQEHPGYVRADMRFLVNDDSKRVTHTNMWLASRSVPILDFMDPLPLVVVTPLFMASLDPKLSCTHYEAHLNGSFGTCSSCLLSCIDEKKELVQTKQEQDRSLFELLFKWRNKLLAEWQSDDLSRHVIFNAKNFTALSDSLWG